MNGRIKELAENLLLAYNSHKDLPVFTVGISGIDASGKGYITQLLQKDLASRGYAVASINIDPWQNPIPLRLQKENAAGNFYNNVFRWNDFFDQLITPLQLNRSIRLETKLIRTDADEYYPFTYRYDDIDIILIDGIFLFQKRFLAFYNWKIWIHCSFEKGLQRAIDRNIEKLGHEQLIHDYNTWYYPAQRLHFQKDDPLSAANCIFNNETGEL